MSKIEGTE